MTELSDVIESIDNTYALFKKYVLDNERDVFSMSERSQMINELFIELLESIQDEDSDSEEDLT